jgi:S-formylglutathione hydrolase FrmB
MKILKKLSIILIIVVLFMIILSTQISAASSVITDSHYSNVLNRTISYNVYLPPSYSESESKYYPVMYLLHGYGGSNTDWTSWGMQSIVDNAGGKEMIIIMPNGFNSFYVDGYQSGIDYDTYMHEELIPHVESKYRIDTADGQNRAIAGLSMGGYGATYHGFKYPDKFSSAYSMSGALEVSINLSTIVDQNNYPAYVMECGTEDTLVYQMNVNFHKTLQSMNIPHDYITRNGTHSVEFWLACLPKAVVFASEHFTSSTTQSPTNTSEITPQPTASTTSTTLPTSTPGQSDDYSVDYNIANDWGSGATVDVKIKNNSSSSIDNWKLSWTFPGNQQITNLWGGSYTQNSSNVTVSANSWNSTLPANGSVSFGFNLVYSGSNTVPTEFILN